MGSVASPFGNRVEKGSAAMENRTNLPKTVIMGGAIGSTGLVSLQQVRGSP